MCPRVARDHARERELHAEDHAVEVDVDHPPGGRVVLVDEAPQRHDPGVVDEHVQRAELLFGAVQEGRKGRPVGHVQRQRDGARARARAAVRSARLEVDVADRHAHAAAQERALRWRVRCRARRP